MTEKPAQPPHTKNPEGRLRRCGFEVEFTGLTPATAAELVHGEFGGELAKDSPSRFKVKDTRFGDFVIELDFRLAHPEKAPRPKEAEESWLGKEFVKAVDKSNKALSAFLGDISEGIVPCEIITPPIPWDKLGETAPLFRKLREKGAKGVEGGFLYGFGLHLNPEAAKLDAPYILAVLRAYIILSAWLRDAIGIDLTRVLLPFINPFPKTYAKKIMQPDYDPDLKGLIDDYLADNPTRNRELDLLPLFAHLEEKKVRSKVPDPKIKARPAFHYRLPNSSLSDSRWDILAEWKRWVAVERLAADEACLKAAAQAFLEYNKNPLKLNWLAESKRYAGT